MGLGKRVLPALPWSAGFAYLGYLIGEWAYKVGVVAISNFGPLSAFGFFMFALAYALSKKEEQ